MAPALPRLASTPSTPVSFHLLGHATARRWLAEQRALATDGIVHVGAAEPQPDAGSTDLGRSA